MVVLEARDIVDGIKEEARLNGRGTRACWDLSCRVWMPVEEVKEPCAMARCLLNFDQTL